MVTRKRTSVIVPLKKLNITLEGLQICQQNVERLYLDSQKVTSATKIALLELAFEEAAKTMALIFKFETTMFDRNRTIYKQYIQTSHIDKKRYDKKLHEMLDKMSDTTKIEGLVLDEGEIYEMFRRHEVKIEYLKALIDVVRDVIYPLNMAYMNRSEVIKELYGKYYPSLGKDDLDEIDSSIPAALSIDTKQLSEIKDIRLKATYVEIKGRSLMSPQSQIYETKLIELLVFVLLSMSKTEIMLISKAIEKIELESKSKGE